MAKEKFKKQILRYGEWKHPSAPEGILEITKDFAKKLVENFKHTPFAPVLRGHQSLQEADKDTSLIISKNIQSLDFDDDGINVTLEMDPAEIDKYNDVSAGLLLDYENHETGETIGPVLEHLALVTTPYIKGLNPFAPLGEVQDRLVIYLSDIQDMAKTKINASEDQVEETTEEVVEETTEEVEEAPTEEVEETTEDTPAESEGEEADEDESVDTSELALKVIRLEEQVAKERRLRIQGENKQTVETYLSEGKILPKQSKALMGLLSHSESTVNLSEGGKTTVGKLLEELLGAQPALVNLEEKGITLEQGGPESLDATVLAEIRKSKAHAKKTEDQWQDYVAKNEVTLRESIRKYKQ